VHTVADVSTDSCAGGIRRRWQAAVVLLAVLGVGIVLLATAKYGAGLTTDSVYYLDAARSLAAGSGYVSHSGEPLVWWPPLYPMLLALVSIVAGLDPAAFAHLVNAALFALLVGLASALLRAGFQHTTAYSILGVCAIVFSAPLSGVYAMAWSECLFIPLVAVWLVAAQRYRTSHGLPALAAMILSAALAGMTRYVGVVLVLANLLVVLFAAGISLQARFARAGAATLLSLAPLGFWLVRNYQQAGTLSGSRFHPVFELVTNVILLLMLMLAWYEPIGLVAKPAIGAGVQVVKPATLSVSLFVAMVAFFALAAALLLSRRARALLSHGLKTALRRQQPAVLFLGVYSAALVLLAARGASSFVDQRLVAPLYVPATVFALGLAYRLFARERSGRGAFTRGVPVLLLSLWLCFPLARVLRSTAARYRNGAGGYNVTSWRQSETLAHARQMASAGGRVDMYSNGRDVLWALARVDAGWVPARTGVALSDLRGRWPESGASAVVWFDSIVWRKQLFTIEELGEISNVAEVARFSDGAFYRVSARDTTAPD
jgi:hypothetical protein